MCRLPALEQWPYQAAQLKRAICRKKPPALGLSMQSSRLRKQLLSKTWPAPQRKQESYDEYPKQESSGMPNRKPKREARPSALTAAPVPSEVRACLMHLHAMHLSSVFCQLGMSENILALFWHAPVWTCCAPVSAQTCVAGKPDVSCQADS